MKPSSATLTSETRRSEDEFALVKSGSTLRKETAKPRHVIGTGTSFKSLAAADPLRRLFIYSVSASATIDDLREFITTFHDIDLKYVELLQPSARRTPGSTSKSSPISVAVADYETLARPESRPDGVKVRRIFPVKLR